MNYNSLIVGSQSMNLKQNAVIVIILISVKCDSWTVDKAFLIR